VDLPIYHPCHNVYMYMYIYIIIYILYIYQNIRGCTHTTIILGCNLCVLIYIFAHVDIRYARMILVYSITCYHQCYIIIFAKFLQFKKNTFAIMELKHDQLFAVKLQKQSSFSLAIFINFRSWLRRWRCPRRSGGKMLVKMGSLIFATAFLVELGFVNYV